MLDYSAIFQIAILTLAIYAILKRAKGSRFGQVLMGVGLLAAFMIACSLIFRFDVLSQIIKSLLTYLAISSVVIFQPEIRRILSAVGAFGFVERPKHNANGSATPELMTETVTRLAEARIGALIAFERGISLRGYEQTGVRLDGIVSRELMQTIFTPPLPLHDGGVTIRDGRLSSAHCIFPVSNNPDLIASGMRHRAAVGLSEETDALVVVVSEESGAVSIAHNGHLYRYSADRAGTAVRRWLEKALNRDERPAEKFQAAVGRLVTRFARGKATAEQEAAK